jgi:glutamyl-tRNA reductase
MAYSKNEGNRSMTSANWRLVAVYVTHKTATLEQREPLQISMEDLAAANATFGNLPEALESAVVSTCNRVEFYFCTRRMTDAFDVVVEFYRQFKDIDISDQKDLFRVKRNLHAADHFFRVAAGIESMVLGENQIFGQIKDAYSSACAVKTAGKVIHRLFHQAFRVGKQVRSDTGMGKGACSVSSAAVEMLRSRVGELVNPSILFIGINRMIDLAAKNLADIEHASYMFANRTKDKAVEYAQKYHAPGHSLDELPTLITNADIVISCTSSPQPVVTSDMIDKAMRLRPDRKLTIVDLAVPRDVAYSPVENGAVAVSDLQDVQAFVNEQQKQREKAIPQAEEIIDRKLGEFKYWFNHVMNEPLYAGRVNGIDAIRREELASILDNLPQDLQDKLNRVTKRIVDRVVQVTSRPTMGKSE